MNIALIMLLAPELKDAEMADINMMNVYGYIRNVPRAYVKGVSEYPCPRIVEPSQVLDPIGSFSRRDVQLQTGQGGAINHPRKLSNIPIRYDQSEKQAPAWMVSLIG